MSDIHDIRRDNVRRLMRQYGSPAVLSEKLGYANSSYLAHIAGPNPSKNIGERAARDMEEKLGLPDNWLDTKHMTPTETEQLVEIVTRVAVTAQQCKVNLPPTKLTELAILAHEHAKHNGGHLEQDYLTRLVMLLKR